MEKRRFLERCLALSLACLLVFGSIGFSSFVSEAKTVTPLSDDRFERLKGVIFSYNDGVEIATSGNIPRTTRTRALSATEIFENSKTPLPLSRWKTYYQGTQFSRAWNTGGSATLFEIKDLNGSIKVKYKNMGEKGGRKVDCVVTFSGFVPTNDYKSSVWTGYSYPCIDISHCITDGYWSEFLKQFHINMQFQYEDGSPADIQEFYLYNGSMNLGEGIVSPSNTSVIYATSNTNINQIADGRFVGASSYFNDYLGGESYATTDGQVLKEFNANSISMRCVGNSISYTVFQDSVKNADLIVEGVPWTSEGVTGNGNGANSDFWNCISFSPLRTSTAPDPQKVAVVNDQEVETVEGVDVGDELTFKVKQQVEILGLNGSVKYDSFTLTDTLPAELDYKDAYLLNEDTGEKVSSADYKLTVSGDKKTIQAAFTSDFLKNSMKYQGETYSLVIKAAVNSVTYAIDPFENRASTTIDGDQAHTNVVKVKAKRPALAITKSSSKYEWKVGDKVDYTVKVTHAANSSKVSFKDMVVSDISLPAGLAAIDQSVSGISGATVTKSGNGWTAKVAKLTHGQTLTVTFHCTAKEAVNGTEIVNTATANAVNADTVQDVEEVYVNSAVLTIDKKVSKYECQVGDTVDYTVDVTNTRQNSIANNVTVSDITLPKGLNLQGAPVWTGVPGTVARPAEGNKNIHGETISEKVTTSVKQQNNGFTASISALPTGVTARLTFHCKVEDVVNGTEIINTAHAKADNAADVKDNAKIWVNTPGLQIKKEADSKTAKIGEIVTYTLKVSNTDTGTLARNIVIEDKLDNASSAFAKLQKNSIVLMDSDGNKIEDAKITVSGNTFCIETGRNLICPDVNYGIWNLENTPAMQDGGKLNPEGIKKETLLTVEYQMKVTDKASGESIKNIATASSDEIPGVEDKEEVVVNGPHLDVEKSSDKRAYTPTDTAAYKVVVRQTREGYTAEDVTITDMFDREGMDIQKDSIQVRLNGKEIAPASVKLNDAKNGYAIKTGIDLDDADKLTVTYQVKFVETTLMDEKDVQFTNTVTAKGTNTNESMDENTVVASYKEAVLQVRKTSDQDEYVSGGTGEYEVQIKQLVEGASAKQVMLKDTFDKEGMEIQEDSIQVKLNGKKITPVSVQLNDAKNGYTIETGMDLGEDDKLVVTYQVSFPDEKFQSEEGERLVNTVTAKGTNTNESTDENEVQVVYYKPVLKTVKTSDEEQYTSGSEGTYKIEVTQTKESAVTKQVVLTDTFDKEGMEIQPDSIKVKLNNKKIAPVSVKVNDAKNGYTIESGVDLSEDDKLTVTYQVSFPEEKFQSEVGTKLVNTVTVKGTNADESTDENKVQVVYYKPVLKTVKTSDEEQYTSGSEGTYKIEVTQTKESAVAKQAVLTDTFDKKGMQIQPDSIKVKLNNKKITPVSVKVNDAKNGYTIESGVDLSEDDKLTVTYQVSFPEEKFQSEVGTKLVNTVTVKGTNADESTDSNEVSIFHEPALPEVQTGDIVKTGGIVLGLLAVIGGGVMYIRRKRK